MRRLSDEAFKVGVQTLTLFIMLHGCMTSCGYDTRCFDGCPPEEPRIVEHTTEVIKAVTVVGSRGYYHDRGSVSTQAEAEEIIRNHQKLVADIKRHDIELREAAKHEGVVKEFGPTYDSILRRIK